MLLECVLAVITICAINFAYKNGITSGATAIFAGGVSMMYAGVVSEAGVNMLNTLLVLTYSAFCLTSLDTATRLARFMFQEFFLKPGQTAADIKDGWKKVLINPYVSTIITVVLGILLGMTGYSKIWGLFGAANQLLAGIGLLAVATWLHNIGKNNKMFLFPMAFMIVVTICSLGVTVKNQIMIIAGKVMTAEGAVQSSDWGNWAQAILGILLIILSIVLVVEGINTLKSNRKKTA